jgi:hypothetical protein
MEVCYDAFIHPRSESPVDDEPHVGDKIGVTISDLIGTARVDYNISQYLIMEYKRLYEELQIMMREAHAEHKCRDRCDMKHKLIRNLLSYCYSQQEYNSSGYKYPDIGIIDVYANCAELLCVINEKLFQLRYQSEVIIQFMNRIERDPILVMNYMRKSDSKLYLLAQ